jgi:hypothetical protein
MIHDEDAKLTFLTPTELRPVVRCAFTVIKRGISAGTVVYQKDTIHRTQPSLLHYVVCADERVLAALRDIDMRGYTFAMKLSLTASAQVGAARYSITQEHIRQVAAAHLAALRQKAASAR